MRRTTAMYASWDSPPRLWGGGRLRVKPGATGVIHRCNPRGQVPTYKQLGRGQWSSPNLQTTRMVGCKREAGELIARAQGSSPGLRGQILNCKRAFLRTKGRGSLRSNLREPRERVP